MKNKLTAILFLATIAVFSLFAWLFPKSDYSDSERRVLASAPEVSAENIFSGKFASQFEEYSTDTFPFRDGFRGIKALSSEYLFFRSDNNKLFSQSGHLAKIEYPLVTPMLDNAANKFNFICEKYLKDANIYLTIVPDKNFFLKTLKIDYETLVTYMCEKLPQMEYIDVFPHLSLDNYYFTDSHWKQETILPVAKKIAAAMGCEVEKIYTENVLNIPFYGVYVGQSAKKANPDTIKYLTSDVLNNCTVTSYDTGKAENAAMYNMKKAEGKDAYEMFLSGNNSLLVIENPSAKEKRELVVFRDSFASSLVPLLVSSYSKVTLVDIRYIQSGMLKSFVDFDSCDDALFIYSSSLLNNSLAMK